MTYKVMAYMVVAYIVTAYIVMARTVMATQAGCYVHDASRSDVCGSTARQIEVCAATYTCACVVD